IEWRFAADDYARLPELAAELVRLPVDVIVADGTPATLAAQKATQTIPIVFASVGDALGTGLVKDLAHPRRNTTGNSVLLPELAAKQLEILMLAIPKLSHVAILQNSMNAGSRMGAAALLHAASSAKLRASVAEASTPAAIDSALADVHAAGAQAFLVV